MTIDHSLITFFNSFFNNNVIQTVKEFKSLVSNVVLKAKEHGGVNERISDKSVEEMNLLA